MYEILWTQKALECLDKLEPFIASRIVKKVEELKEDPFSKDIKHLKGMNVYRMRVGDYRIIFQIDSMRIHILKAGHRKNIYDFG